MLADTVRIGTVRMDGEDAFQAAADFVEAHVDQIDDKCKLRLYGLFKQASSGACSTAKPSFFDFKGRAKW